MNLQIWVKWYSLVGTFQLIVVTVLDMAIRRAILNISAIHGAIDGSISMSIQDTIGKPIMMVAVYGTVWNSIQNSVSKQRIMIDICQSQVAMGVSCQVRATTGLALIAADPKTWMVNLTELFPSPTLEGQKRCELETFYHGLGREEYEIAWEIKLQQAEGK